jgi:UDP:flavonoid glycosyltransferase YjiC (YdhE family)
MPSHHIAYFVSPHGFGHAARACAVMTALHTLDAALEFEIFTRAPRWFFAESLGFAFGYHELLTDIGLVQRSPLEEDLTASLGELEKFIPFSAQRLDALALSLSDLGCRLVLCDISPLGIAAAQAAHLPAILIENFTWDWIYSGYRDAEPEFERFIPEFARLFASATAHIQTEPVCAPSPTATLTTNPVGRTPRLSATAIRQELRIPEGAAAVLITMGGFELEYTFLERFKHLKDTYFIVPGGAESFQTRGNLILLPHHSAYYHPDLLYAADAVISKAGYSTIAEAYQAGIPFGYVSRALFRESPILSDFIRQQMQGIAIDGATFDSGEWIDAIPQLLSLPRISRPKMNGAEQIALFIYTKFIE